LAYAIAFGSPSATLRTLPVGIAYAIWSGVGIVLTSGIGWILLGQTLDLPAVVGMALISAGVIVVNLSSNANPH